MQLCIEAASGDSQPPVQCNPIRPITSNSHEQYAICHPPLNEYGHLRQTIAKVSRTHCDSRAIKSQHRCDVRHTCAWPATSEIHMLDGRRAHKMHIAEGRVKHTKPL